MKRNQILYMHLDFTSVLLVLMIAVSSKTISYAYQSGTFTFDQSNSSMEAQIQHISSPVIFYSLIMIQTSSYFGFQCDHQKKDGYPLDKIILLVRVNGLNLFLLTLQYVLVESMPNLQIAHVNLTWSKPSKMYHSRKNLIFDDNCCLAAHLVGFSSSQFAQDSYFFAIKGTATYHIYTTINLTVNHWIAMHVIIFQLSYSDNEILCIGNQIDIRTQVSSNNLPLEVEISKGLSFLIGLEAIYSRQAKFKFSADNNIIQFEGIYSYSVIAINTTCVIMQDNDIPFSCKGRIYFILTIVFLALISLVVVGFLIFYWTRKFCLLTDCVPSDMQSERKISQQIKNLQGLQEDQDIQEYQIGEQVSISDRRKAKDVQQNSEFIV